MGRRIGRTREFRTPSSDFPEDDTLVMANYAHRRLHAFRMLVAPTERLPEPPSQIAEFITETCLLPALRRGLGR